MLSLFRTIRPLPFLSAKYHSRMATTKASLSHVERTAEEPRDNSLHTVTISRIETINSKIRLYQLTPTNPPIKFLPGQWLDVYCPSISKAGGFTITSSPQTTKYLELAIQKSPDNPPAKWLWQPPEVILGRELRVRVGGSFVWPPKGREGGVKRVVFVAGGVGINPLMSMMSFIADKKKKREGLERELKIRFLYSTKGEERGDEVLFLGRLVEICKDLGEGELSVFLTGTTKEKQETEVKGQKIIVKRRRISKTDLLEALGPVEDRTSTACYICGVPTMTDEFIENAKKAAGMLDDNVLFEKWW